MKILAKSVAVAAIAMSMTGVAEARIQAIGDATADGSELLFNLVNYTAQNSYTLDLGITIAQFRTSSDQTLDSWSALLNADSNFQAFLATYDASHNVTWGVSGGHQLLNELSDLPIFGFYTTSVSAAPAVIDVNAADINNTQGVWSTLVADIQTQDSNANNLSTFRSVGEQGYTAVYGNDFLTALPFQAQGNVGEALAFLQERVNADDFDTGELTVFGGKWLFDINNGVAVLKYDVSAVSEVPVPAAAWMFGSALLGLLGLNRRKAA
ncbi:hypothetical protein NP590_05285 [Methylomonas sp. SURF-2]|uniref:PEP-CTERM protein-sorting domain-containing protein n=1 Tax=Methylomonas subterranea TaxID=2952225 RepID=A0ABT1TDI2_9GAMM|nr:hypothetical protein [Methylomonas sp. SURF-2]MCQ8103512.1 hypothetical protein [Methylomonas sp. SURF-2]